MEANQAVEHLQVIRTLMERSAVYRRALAPIMTFCGVLGAVAGLVGWRLKFQSGQAFLWYWAATAVVAQIGAFLLVRRQSLKDSEPFWSPPTRRVAQAMLPSLAVGCLAGLVLVFGVLSENRHPDFTAEGAKHNLQNYLVFGWAILYGCALHSAGFFISRGFQMLGWLFCAAGSALLVYSVWRPGIVLEANLLMAGLFGGLHLAAGVYLYFSEQRKNVA